MIRLISTGGTICGIRDIESQATSAGKTAQDLAGLIQKKEIAYETAMQLLSEDMTPSHWIKWLN